MSEQENVNEGEITVSEARAAELRQMVDTIQKNLAKREVTTFERVLVGSYLMAEGLLELESEDMHPRDTFLLGLEALNNALADFEAEQVDEDEDEEAAS